MYVTFHTITLQCFINISCSTSNRSLLPRRSSVFKEDNWTIWSTLIVVKLLLDRSKCSRLGSSNTPSGNFVSPLLDRLREVKVVSFCWFWVNHSARRQTVEKKEHRIATQKGDQWANETVVLVSKCCRSNPTRNRECLCLLQYRMAQVLPQELPRCSHIMFLQTNDSEEFSSSFAMVSNCDASLSDLATPGTMDLLIWAVEKKCLIMLCCGSLLSVFQCRIHIFRTACGCVVCEPRAWRVMMF